MTETIARHVFDCGQTSSETYTPSRRADLHAYEPYVRASDDVRILRDADLLTLLQPRFAHLDELGPLEQLILASLMSPLSLPPPNPVRLLVGARGAGKSATTQFLRDFVRRSSTDPDVPSRRPLLVYVDIAGAPMKALDTPDEAFNQVCTYLADGLADGIVHCWDEMPYVLKWIRGSPPSGPPNAVYGFLTGLGEPCGGGDSLRTGDGRRVLENALAGLSPTERLQFCLLMLSYLHLINPQRYSFVCIDNSDSHDPILGLRLQSCLRESVAGLSVPLLLPIRPATYVGAGSTSSSVIPHAGISPAEVVRAKMLRTSVRAAYDSVLARATPSEQLGFLLRVGELYSVFTRGDPDFARTFEAVAGSSVPRGFGLAARMFESRRCIQDLSGAVSPPERERLLSMWRNCTTDSAREFVDQLARTCHATYQRAFTGRVPRVYHYIQCLLEQAMEPREPDGQLLTLLYRCDHHEGACSVRMLTLSMIQRAREDRGRPVELREIARHLSDRGYSVDEAVDAVNTLQASEERLIWTTGLGHYRDYEEFQRMGSAVAGTTESGMRYLEVLAQSPEYVTLAASWDRPDRERLWDFNVVCRTGYMLRCCYDALIDTVSFYLRVCRGRTTANMDLVLARPYEVVCAREIAAAIDAGYRDLDRYVAGVTEVWPVADIWSVVTALTERQGVLESRTAGLPNAAFRTDVSRVGASLERLTGQMAAHVEGRSRAGA